MSIYDFFCTRQACLLLARWVYLEHLAILNIQFRKVDLIYIGVDSIIFYKLWYLSVHETVYIVFQISKKSNPISLQVSFSFINGLSCLDSGQKSHIGNEYVFVNCTLAPYQFFPWLFCHSVRQPQICQKYLCEPFLSMASKI